MNRTAATQRDTHFETRFSKNVDAQALSAELSETIKGEVHFDAGFRALYAHDGSNYRQVPIGVVIPKSREDIITTVRISSKYNAPVLLRGGGTSLAGQCCNVAVVMDQTKYYNRVLQVDPESMTATVEGGCVLDKLREQAEQHGLTFAPDPATHDHCTLGGMIGNNSCGIHSVLGQMQDGGIRTSDFVEELEIMTYAGEIFTVGKTSEDELAQIIRQGGRKGEIYQKLKALRDKYGDLIRERYPNIPRRVSGFNLDDLLPENGFHVARALSGSEGTCVTYLKAKLRLVKNPEYRTLVVLGFDSLYAAAATNTKILEYKPIALEGIDKKLIGYMKKTHLHLKDLSLLPDGDGFLLVEFGGKSKEEADGFARQMMDDLKKMDSPPTMKLYDDKKEEQQVWEVRESGLGATAFVPGLPDTWPGWEDSAVPPEKMADYLKDLRELFHKYEYEASLYGHFGQGCVHCRIPFDLRTAEGIAQYKQFTNEAADLVISYGGSLSAEHGDGQARGELLEKMYGPELVQAFREFKEIWDPNWRMNPGKVVDPWGRDVNLRLGSDYNPREPDTYFGFPNDEGRFSQATLRCVGVGKCRRHKDGTMCPSYKVTLDEQHSTRGRAHLLFEMLQGDVVKDGWKSEPVKEALDLCLSCKGCLGDCPVDVDIATYKAEFLAHYYKGKIRPRVAYAFGLIHWVAQVGSKIPRLVNLITRTPVLKDIVKAAAGMAPQRQIPLFATETFREWFSRHEPQHPQGEKVILWPDTFNNHFYPDVLKAATEVLETQGFHVVIPQKHLCCGRPLYDYGMLNLAKQLWLDVMNDLREEIHAGTPVVGVEPSCVAAFRNELTNMLPKEEDAKRLQEQTFTLAEFLEKKVENYTPPKLKRKAMLHRHCHHHAVMGTESEEKLLKDMGLELEVLDSGCCGMAGSFGFEAGERYDVSVKVGELALLPKVRQAEPETLILTDGFSCREQIIQTTNRRPLHLAQLLRMAQKANGQADQFPEQKWTEEPQEAESKLSISAVAIAGLGLLVGGFLVSRIFRR